MIAGEVEIAMSGNCKVPASPPAASSNGQAEVSMEPLLVSGAAAAALLGVSARTWRRLVSAGKVGPIALRIGASRRYLVKELRAWCAAGCPSRARWEQRMQVQK